MLSGLGGMVAQGMALGTGSALAHRAGEARSSWEWRWAATADGSGWQWVEVHASSRSQPGLLPARETLLHSPVGCAVLLPRPRLLPPAAGHLPFVCCCQPVYCHATCAPAVDSVLGSRHPEPAAATQVGSSCSAGVSVAQQFGSNCDSSMWVPPSSGGQRTAQQQKLARPTPNEARALSLRCCLHAIGYLRRPSKRPSKRSTPRPSCPAPAGGAAAGAGAGAVRRPGQGVCRLHGVERGRHGCLPGACRALVLCCWVCC